MQKQFLRLLHLGQNTFWQLLESANTASEEHLQNLLQDIQKAPLHVWIGDKNTEDKALFLQFLQDLGLNYTEHDCSSLDLDALEATAAQYDGEGTLNITCGFNETQVFLLTRESKGAWFNGLSACSCPWAGMAEAALQVRLAQELDTWRVCWLGAVTPLAQSFMEAAIYTPFELFMGIPTWSDPDHSSTDMALKSGAKIFMTREPRLALDEAHIIYMDASLEALSTAKPTKAISLYSISDAFIWEKGLALTEQQLAHALPQVRIVSTEIQATYAKADASLQEQRKHLQRAMFLTTLHHVLTKD